MIPDEKIAEIRRLLHESPLSQRQIAQQLGVSRGTVNAVATGRLRRRLQSEFAAPPPDPLHPTEPPQRCPTCGALVYMPCVACRVRAILARRRRRRTAPREELACSGEAAR